MLADPARGSRCAGTSLSKFSAALRTRLDELNGYVFPIQEVAPAPLLFPQVHTIIAEENMKNTKYATRPRTVDKNIEK